MQVTRSYIMANRTNRGAWTRSQIEALGVEWPPRQGWIDRIVGTEISAEAARRFEAKEPAHTKKHPIECPHCGKPLFLAEEAA